jgi:hypothetical protein
MDICFLWDELPDLGSVSVMGKHGEEKAFSTLQMVFNTPLYRNLLSLRNNNDGCAICWPDMEVHFHL